MKRAEADFGFIMTGYNLRRIINIIGVEELRKYMASIFRHFLMKIKRFKLILNQRNRIRYKTIKTDCCEFLFPKRFTKHCIIAPEVGF